jgi:putative nucleotidyltransferase with HDIG domain
MSISPEDLRKKVSGLSNLPTLPGVAMHISRMVEDKNSSASDIGDIIAKDQVLSARILRLVNSPVYGFPGRISSVTHALVLLGFNVVKGLVLGTSVFESFAKQAQGLWRHSLGCAVVSRRLSRELGVPDVEEIMVAGLLHDLGKAVLSHVVEKEFSEAVQIAKDKNCHIALAEREIFGVDHARVASWIADEWHLPPGLSDALTYHHRPDLAKHNQHMTSIVHLADILARGMEYGWPGDATMPPLNHEAFQLLNISYEQIDRVIQQSEAEFASGSDILSTGD